MGLILHMATDACYDLTSPSSHPMLQKLQHHLVRSPYSKQLKQPQIVSKILGETSSPNWLCAGWGLEAIGISAHGV